MQKKFFEACENGDLNEVNRLLQVEGVDATADDNFAIRWASRDGYFKVVNRLLQVEEVDATAYNNDAIGWASQNGHLEVVNRLLQDPKVRADSANLLKYLKETYQEDSKLYKLVDEMHNQKFKTKKSAVRRIRK